MTFGDIFKSDFLENVTEFSIIDTIVGMLFALVIGMFICLIYRKTFSGIMFSTGFAMALVGLTLVTTLVIMAVTSNVVLSLGMVGALSIVRFRAAIKEPMEIVFLFWALAVGIVIGAGMIPLAVIGSVIIGVVLLVYSSKKLNYTPFIVIVDCIDDKSELKALDVIDEYVDKYFVKSKTISESGIEFTAEVRVKDDDTAFMNKLNKIKGVDSATLVTFNGEYIS